MRHAARRLMMPSDRRARRPRQDVVVLGLDAQRNRERRGHHEVRPQHHDRRDGQRPADHQAAGDRGDLSQRDHDQEHDDALKVAVDDAALFDRTHDRGEVVVGEHHVGGFLGDLRAGDAHGDTDVGALEGRRVVDAVAGHRHDLAQPLQGLDDAHLVARLDPREHRDVAHTSGQRRVVERVELDTRDHRVGAGVCGQDPHAPSDRRAGGRMVARDHLHRDARALCRRDRLSRPPRAAGP